VVSVVDRKHGRGHELLRALDQVHDVLPIGQVYCHVLLQCCVPSDRSVSANSAEAGISAMFCSTTAL
jgi:hypothetical protein